MSNPRLISGDKLGPNYVETIPSSNYMLLKRIFDLVMVIILLPVTLPLVLVTAILVKLESKGPVFFTQLRVGMNGQTFNMYKIRSMHIDSEHSGTQFAREDDTRITRIGHFIRKSRIDELPQFWNIVKGEMSLIGPRPEQLKFVEEFERSIPHYNDRHLVLPGITGLAQTVQGYVDDQEGTEIKLKYDLYYIKNLSLAMELEIIYRTILTVFTGFGSR